MILVVPLLRICLARVCISQYSSLSKADGKTVACAMIRAIIVTMIVIHSMKNRRLYELSAGSGFCCGGKGMTTGLAIRTEEDFSGASLLALRFVRCCFVVVVLVVHC